MKENLLAKYILIFCLISPLVSLAQEVKDTTRKVVFLKDGSILKGQVIEDSEYNLIIVTNNLDTLDYSYKYIQSVKDDTPESYADVNLNLIKPKYQKTSGYFLNLDISVFPLSVQVGRRVTPSLNVGGQYSSFHTQRDLDYGVSAYSKYFFSKNQGGGKVFGEFYIGLLKEDNNNEPDKLEPFAGIGFGIHLPSRKLVRFYFKAGGYSVRDKNETIIRNSSATTIIKSSTFNFYPQLTLLGIEF